MMWFDEIMDDCKRALQIASDNKGIFIPVFIKLGFGILLLIFIVGIALAYGISLGIITSNGISGFDAFLKQLPLLIILIFITLFLIIVVSSILEVGSINLYKAASQEIKLTSSIFFEGIKKYFFKVFSGTLLIDFIVLLLSPIILTLFILYAVIVGTLTAGWGITILSVIVMVYLNAWRIIVVVDNVSPAKAIGLSFRLGRKYFWAMFIIMLSYILLSRYLITVLGPMAAAIGGWFIAGVVSAYFKLVILLIYNRKKENLI